ncbi:MULTISPECIES: GNAT family N-acetyltransferase [unclassified Pseudonocardia]|uniref:GNAT family N-acetyltransferase n=1 Tax=Pseudonocardia sp. Ae263_Ps1 TaxID=1885030 RepID=UPI0011153E68
MTSSPSTRATHTPGFDRVVRRDDGAFAALGAEWDALHRRCPTAGVFQSVEWLESWWRSYGRPGALRLVVVRRDGRAVAGAALTRTVRAGGGRSWSRSGPGSRTGRTCSSIRPSRARRRRCAGPCSPSPAGRCSTCPRSPPAGTPATSPGAGRAAA